MNITLGQSLSRRQFITRTAAGVSLGFVSGAGLPSIAADEKPKKTLRVIAYNVYECTGWPKDRALGQKATALGQMPTRFAQELVLYKPDVVTLSESPREQVAKDIAEQLRMKSVRFPSGGDWPGTLMTRLPIVDSKNTPVVGGTRPKELFTRHWGCATLELPGGKQMTVHSAHLHPSEREIRVREIAEILKVVKDDLKAGRWVIVMGDLNHTPDLPEYLAWAEAGLIDTFAKVGKGDGVTFQADGLNRRIDYVWAGGPLADKIVEARPLAEGAFRLSANDTTSFVLSDHLPQLAVFELGR